MYLQSENIAQKAPLANNSKRVYEDDEETVNSIMKVKNQKKAFIKYDDKEDSEEIEEIAR